jgi:hypothetical protein
MKSSIFTRHTISVCQDSSVDIMSGYRLDSPDLTPGSARVLLSMSRMALEPTQPPNKCVLGALSPEEKLQGREADHSPPSSAEVKNGVAIPPLPLMSSDTVLN